MKFIFWGPADMGASLQSRLPNPPAVVNSMAGYLAAQREGSAMTFLAASALEDFENQARAHNLDLRELYGPRLVVISDDKVSTAVNWLPTRPWMSHVMSEQFLNLPHCAEHLKNLTATLTGGRPPRLLEWLDTSIVGRRVRLAQASRRAERLDRMGEYYESHGVGSRTIELLRDAAEELLTNAFYDAPVAAGVVRGAISRTQDVALSSDTACDMVYGCKDDLAIVRVKDPFGSLTRERLVQVLTRCARTDMQVEPDESMGGAGLGLWRIFSVATFVGISVVASRHTEVLVGIAKRPAGARPFAFHLFFKDPGKAVRRWKMLDATTSKPNLDNSITIVSK